jgi:TolB-like protein
MTFKALLLLTLSGILFTGCSTTNLKNEDELKVFKQNQVYGSKIAKELVQINPDAKIILASFVNENDFEETDGLGRITTEQIAGQLVQRGLQVQEMRLRKLVDAPNITIDNKREGEFSLSRDIKKIAAEQNADFVVTGVYSYGEYNAIIAMKAIDRNGMVVAAFNYTVPATVSFDWDKHSIQLFQQQQSKAQRNIYWDPYEKLDNGDNIN